MLAVIANDLMSVHLVPAVGKGGSFLILTTNDRSVDLNGRPKDGIAGGVTYHIC